MHLSHHTIRHLHPILERRYHEETKLYLWGDADDTTISRTQSGVYLTDLRKTTLFASLGALAILLLLRRK